MTAEAPDKLNYERNYEGVRSSVAQVRDDLRRVLTAHHFDPLLVDDAVLCVSELATNVVTHVTRDDAQTSYLVRACRCVVNDEPVLHLQVHDDLTYRFPSWPGARPMDNDEATSGRGLPLVALLSVNFGYQRTPGEGKFVFCELSLTANGAC